MNTPKAILLALAVALSLAGCTALISFAPPGQHDAMFDAAAAADMARFVQHEMGGK